MKAEAATVGCIADEDRRVVDKTFQAFLSVKRVYKNISFSVFQPNVAQKFMSPVS